MAEDADSRPRPGRRALLIAALAPALVPRPANASAAAGLSEAVRTYDRATVTNDTAALGEIVADDYMLVNSDSSVQDKASYLADFRVPGFRLDPYVMREPVLKVWGDSAVTGGLLSLSWTQAGERHVRLLRIAHVWTRERGRWRLRYTQLTRVPDPVG
jgi:ketosteroid isomerase-like protein